MDTEYEPVINNWYRHQGTHQYFCIIDIDESGGLLEIQHANGDLDTMDIETWYEAGMTLAPEPELWSDTADNNNDDSDDIETDDEPQYWQEETAEDDRPRSPVNVYRGVDTTPDAIDERLMFGEGQDGESEMQYDMSEADFGW